MNFDIDSLEQSANNTYRLTVGQRDDGTPVGFVLVGPASDQFNEAERRIQVFNIREAANRQHSADVNTDEGAALIAAGTDERRAIVAKHCVVDWYGFTLGENEPAPFTPENLDRVLKARKNWVRLIAMAIDNEANFTAG